LTESAGKDNLATQPLPPQAARGARWGGTYPRHKDSNAAVGVHNHATGKALEGADGQTDKQTFCPL